MAEYGGYQPSVPKSVSRPGKKKGSPACSSLSITKVENGFTVRKSYDSNGMGPYVPSEEHVFTDVKAVEAFVDKSLGKLH